MARDAPDTDARTREWPDRARFDVENARTLFDASPSAYDNVGFLRPQAARKIIKAFLVGHCQSFPKTHDIRRLPAVGYVAKIDPELALAARFADELTPYAIEGRYPLGLDPLTRECAEELLATLDRAWALFEPRILELVAADKDEEPGPDEEPSGDATEADSADSDE